MLAAGKGRSGRYSNRKKQPNRDRLTEVEVGGGGGWRYIQYYVLVHIDSLIVKFF